MEFLFGLLDNPLVLGAGGVVALLILYRFVANRVRVRVPATSLTTEGLAERVLGSRWTQKKLAREVARLKKQGNYLAAGKLLEDSGQNVAAAEAYLEGQEYWAAASSYEKLGRTERAAELYLQAGDYKKGATLFTAAGKPARAAALFLEKGNNLEAARLFGLASQWGTSAELYEKSGYPLRAAEAWEKDGKLLKAAEAYEKHFTEHVSYSTTYSSTAPNPEAKSAALAGRLYEQAGDLARAVAAYSRGNFHREAAEALLKLGQPAKAAELFLRAEDEERAAAAFDQAGEAGRAAMLRGEAAFKGDRPADAAAWFFKGRDFLRAAELYESVGMMAEAAAAYEAGESWAAAGGVYLRASITDRAAAAFERAGELETAASLFEQLGDGRHAAELYGRAGLAFRSGEAAAHAGEREQAIAELQRVPPGDDNYRAATELLARLFIETGRPGLAAERVRKAIGREAISPANLDLFYWLALAQEASGARSEAAALYAQIQSEDLRFRDVAQRLARLHGSPAAAPLPPLEPPAHAVAPAAPAVAAPAAVAPAAPVASAPVAAPPESAPPQPAPAAATPQPRPPRFVLREEVGRGPLGVVHRGEDAADGRSVAMRIIPADVLGSHSHEVSADLKAAAEISHPNLVKVIAWTEWEGQRCLVTELVTGRNFAEAIASGRRMAFQQVHALGRVAAQVLALLHARGQVHGSVQPSNVMVAAGVIKIADLGLGRLARENARPPSYHAPEGGLSPTDDLYALCALMYHLLTGAHPSSHPQGVGLPLPSQLAPGVPEAMDKLLVRGLHPRPELRLASAVDLLRDLRDMVKIG
ncbi:MAG: protein kinase domain-containing protein [Betaproteobacteria bacterium]